MREIKSGRFIRANALTPVSNSQRKFSKRIALVNRFEILGFRSPKSFDILASDLISEGIVVIKGTGENDGVYRVVAMEAHGDETYRVSVERANFQTSIAKGYLIQARTEYITHGLNASEVDFTLRNEIDGCYYDVAAKTIDTNTLVFTPHTPVEGVFVVVVRV